MGPETLIRCREVFRGHTRINISGVGALKASIAEVPGEAVVVLLNDTPFLVQMKCEVDKRTIRDAVATLASKSSVWIKDDRIRYVDAIVRVHHFVPVGLVTRIVTFVSQNVFMGVHEVTMPWEEGTLGHGPLVSVFLAL